jgi:L-amino acid N-acyltransferase YncA
MLVRAAAAEDADVIRAIYAHHVRYGVGTFEEDPPDVAEMRSRMRSGRWLVAEADDRVLGYACYGPYRARSGYRFTVEDSVYVRPDATGRGVGSRLLAALVEHARAAGHRQMVAAIGSSDNAASIALHESQGFVRAGVLTGVGVKLGRVLDVVLLQRAL